MGLQNSFGAHWLDVTWSLAVEEQFYLIVPFILLFMPVRLALAVLAALIVLAPVFRSQIGGIGAYVLPFCRADALLLGVVCAIVVRQSFWRKSTPMFDLCLTGLLITLGLGCLVLLKAKMMEMGGTFIHSYLAIFYAVVLLWVVRNVGSWFSQPLRWSSLRWIGERSFAIYLFHQPVCGILHGIVFGLRRRSPIPPRH